MEDEEDDDQNSELIKIVNLLVDVRSRKIDRLNRAFRQAVKEHEQSTLEWEMARDKLSKTQGEAKEKKELMQSEMMSNATDIRQISSWLSKEKEIEKVVGERKAFMTVAKNIENNKESESNERKLEYLAAEKRLEKMKLFKDEIGVR